MKNQFFGGLLVACCHVSLLLQAQTSPIDTTLSKTQLIQVESARPVVRPAAYLIPATLMGTGLLTQGYLSRQVRQEVLVRYPGFNSSLDDYLQYTPSVVVLSLGAAGLKGRHSFSDQIALTLLSNAVSQGISQTLKYTIAYPRPDGYGQESFPSGHATNAFTGATLLAHEYGARSAWYTVAGYATATTVASFRVLRNRHWLADVLFGAGVGIGSTELVYGLYPWLKHLIIHRKQTVLVPLYQGNSIGFGLVSLF